MGELPNAMRAVVFGEANAPLQITEKSLPEPGQGELLVRIKAVSFCASDFMQWRVGGVEGLVPGHEAVGVVVKTNGDSGGFSVGDHVGFTNSIRNCTCCAPCLVGQGQFCLDGMKNQGFTMDGFFAEYAVIGPKFAARIPKELPFERLAPLFCAGVTAFRAVKLMDSPARGVIGVFGLGGVGVFACRFAISMGFDVFGFDVSAAARETTERLGVRATFDSSDMGAIAGKVRELTKGRLLDGAIVAVGAPPAYKAALELTGIFKTVVAVGFPREPIPADPMALIRKGLVLKGTMTGAASDLEEMLQVVERHQIIPEVELGKFDDIPELFARAVSGKALGKLGAVIS